MQLNNIIHIASKHITFNTLMVYFQYEMHTHFPIKLYISVGQLEADVVETNKYLSCNNLAEMCSI